MWEQINFNKNEQNYFVVYCTNALILFLLFFICIVYPKDIANKIAPFKDLVISLSCFLILGLISSYSILKKKKIGFNIFDFCFIAFIILNFASWFWAAQASLIWSKSFSYLKLYVIFKTIQILNVDVLNRKYFENAIIIICSINCLIISYSFITAMVKTDGFYLLYNDLSKITKNIKGNGNYISALFAMLIPCFTFFKNKSILLQVLVAFQVAILLLFNSRGASVAIIALGVFYIIQFYSKRKTVKLLKSFAILLLIIIPLFSLVGDKENYFLKYKIESPFETQSNNERVKLWQKSIQLFQKQSLFGVGSGNWKVEHLQFGSSDLKYSFNKNNTYKHAHNFFIECLAELGFVGFVILIICGLFILIAFVKGKTHHSNLLFAFALCYFILLNFYGVVYPIDNSLQPHAIIFVVALSFLIFRNQFTLNHKITFSVLILFASTTIFWSSNQLLIDRKQKSIQIDLIAKNYNKAINDLNLIYRKNFKEYILSKPIKILLAEVYFIQNKNTIAIEAYKLGIKSDPYNFKWWNGIATKHKQLKRNKSAEKAYKNAFELNNNIFSTNLWLANNALKKKNTNDFNTYLSFYTDWLLPIKEKHFQESIWENPQSNEQLKFWKKLCALEDKVLILYSKNNQ